ncbi:hypothetical protein GCM10018779_24780 [Streptomyces griseocarneus]|nr:hypothetical protein GCM10018779_24780 [Streptomyces griseocarneus]
MLVQQPGNVDESLPGQRFVSDQSGVDGGIGVVDELLRFRVHPQSVRRLPTDPLPPLA